LIQSALAATTPPPGLGTRRGFLLGGTVAVISGGLAYRLTRREATAPPLVATLPPAPTNSVQLAAPPPAMTPPVVAAAPPPPVELAPAPAEKVPTRKRISAPREVSDLLNQANEQRRQQRFPQALRLYQQILEQHPRSDEAYVAQVAAASLLVDRLHEPQAALRLFRRALRERPAGSLSEEARLGLCDVQRALKDLPAEKLALQEFLNKHGDSPARPRVQARLTQLVGK
jgi:tetratricopeptide (TPR) repeat protein